MTRKEREQELADKGITGPAANLILKKEAYSRHKDRVQEATESVYRWVGVKAFDDVHRDALAWAACVLDGMGIGGHFGTGINGGTRRFPAFKMCGSGRKFAVDGDAWTAAIDEVSETIRAMRKMVISADKDGPVVVVNGVSYPFPLEENEEYAYWIHALAARILLNEELKGYPVEVGYVAYWAEIYNKIT